MTERLLSTLDDGSSDFAFKQLVDTKYGQECNARFMLDAKKKDLQADWLVFRSQYQPLAKHIHYLVKQAYENSSSQTQHAARAWSVALWIYKSNKIELTGTQTIEDTISVIEQSLKHYKSVSSSSGSPSPSSTASRNMKSDTESKTVPMTEEVDVLQTFQLLKQTYESESDKDIALVKTKVPDSMRISNWHRSLFLSSQPELAGHFQGYHAGRLRTIGVETQSLDGSRHVYPHHKNVRDYLEKLLFVCYRIAKSIDETTYSEDLEYERYLDVFALAAFIQFHFVDIHPFCDGNGRMCRFLSKRLLDAILPFPFPMFNDRDEYIKTLEWGRRACPPTESPSHLMRLLLEEAIQHFRCVLRPHFYFQASSTTMLMATMDDNEFTDEEWREQVIQAFEQMNIGSDMVIDTIRDANPSRLYECPLPVGTASQIHVHVWKTVDLGWLDDSEEEQKSNNNTKDKNPTLSILETLRTTTDTLPVVDIDEI